MNVPNLSLLGLAALVSFIGTFWLRNFLRAKAVVDHPNERSLHTVPTPRGGGVALVLATLFVLAPVFIADTAASVGDGGISRGTCLGDAWFAR